MQLSIFPKGDFHIINAVIMYKQPNSINNVPFAIFIKGVNENNLPTVWDISAFRPCLSIIDHKLVKGVSATIFYENYESLTSETQYKIPRYILVKEKEKELWFINIR